jgi:excisionase family DNA binding protein
MIRRAPQSLATKNQDLPARASGSALVPTSPEGVNPDPSAAFFRIRTATATYGVSRSFIYRALAEGKVVAVKAGRSVLIDGNSLRTYLAGLPRAVFRAPRQ